MKALTLIVLLVTTATAFASFDNQRKMNEIQTDLIAQLEADHTTAIGTLKQKIQTGSPLEKDAALCVVENRVVGELIPCVIDAVTDRTPAPGYHDTGWGYIGRHAGWVIANLIRKLDPSWPEREGLDWRKLRDFCNDEDREMVKSRWTEWWTQYQKKQKPQPRDRRAGKSAEQEE